MAHFKRKRNTYWVTSEPNHFIEILANVPSFLIANKAVFTLSLIDSCYGLFKNGIAFLISVIG